jgi:hypothetical protein
MPMQYLDLVGPWWSRIRSKPDIAYSSACIVHALSRVASALVIRRISLYTNSSMHQWNECEHYRETDGRVRRVNHPCSRNIHLVRTLTTAIQ